MCSMISAKSEAGATAPSPPWLGRAWTAVIAIPLFVVLAFVTGEVMLSALGYPSGDAAPLWASLIVDLAVTAVLLAPCVAAAIFGRRAQLTGSRGAVVPMVIGSVVGIAGVALTIVTEVGNAIS